MAPGTALANDRIVTIESSLAVAFPTTYKATSTRASLTPTR